MMGNLGRRGLPLCGARRVFAASASSATLVACGLCAMAAVAAALAVLSFWA